MQRAREALGSQDNTRSGNDELEAIEKWLRRWEATTLRGALKKHAERGERFVTTSSAPVERLYTPLDLRGYDVLQKLPIWKQRGIQRHGPGHDALDLDEDLDEDLDDRDDEHFEEDDLNPDVAR